MASRFPVFERHADSHPIDTRYLTCSSFLSFPRFCLGLRFFFLLIFLRTLFFKPVNISWSLHFVTVRGTGIDQQLHKVLMNALALTLNEAVCGWAPRLPGSCWRVRGVFPLLLMGILGLHVSAYPGSPLAFPCFLVRSWTGRWAGWRMGVMGICGTVFVLC